MSDLYDPGQHRPLSGPQWSGTRAREAILRIVDDAVAAYQPESLWPNHPADIDGDLQPDGIYRNVYYGAAGMAWGLSRLARAGLAPEFPALSELCEGLDDAWRASPDHPELETGTPPPAPGLIFGESGILLALQDVLGISDVRSRRLAECISRNAQNPVEEQMWGSPGTMLAAQAMARVTREPHWAALWADNAAWLLRQWRKQVWHGRLYGRDLQQIGAGHGFAGNAAILLAGREMLGSEEFAVAARISRTAAELAITHDGLAQWPRDVTGRDPQRAVQWCHGAPGMVVALISLLDDERLAALLPAGGELTWQAGPLRKGPGLCHGTAGNALTFLALWRGTREARWLDRARAFAMDAVLDVDRRRAELGRGRYTLFTGDIGVALLLRACLEPEAWLGFPFLSDALPSRAQGIPD